MNNTSEVFGLMQVTKERKGLLITASIFSTLSSLLQIVPFVGVYKIVEELLTHAGQPSAMDRDLLIYWGIVAFVALIAGLIALYIGGCAHTLPRSTFCTSSE